MNIDVVLGLLVGLIVGLGLALVIVKMRGGNASETIKKLEAEHEKYRQEVDSHFVKTAGLFKGLTDQYRDVYKHMAEGADQLCSEEVKTLQTDLAATGLLSQAEEVVADADKAETESEPEKTETEAVSETEPEKVVTTETKEDAPSDVQPAKDHVEVPVEKPAETVIEEVPEKLVEANTEKKQTSSDEEEFPLASEVEIPSELADKKKK